MTKVVMINKLDLQWRFENALFQHELKTNKFFQEENEHIYDAFYQHLANDNALGALECYQQMCKKHLLVHRKQIQY